MKFPLLVALILFSLLALFALAIILRLRLMNAKIKKALKIERQKNAKVREQLQASKEEAFANDQDMKFPENVTPNQITHKVNSIAPHTTRKVVLVVEDDPAVRSFLKMGLSRNYSVLEAADGQSAFSIAKKEIPDLVVSDLMMPHMNGNKLCARLKQDNLTNHIPIILLTAKVGHENKMEGYRHGADDYIDKPFNSEELLLRAANLIALRERLREKFSFGFDDGLRETEPESEGHVFLQKAIAEVERNLEKDEFTVEEWSQALHISRRQLHRKLTAITGTSPLLVIRKVRLNTAMRLLQEGNHNISEVSYTTGFSSVSYFSRVFKQEFGFAPSQVKDK